jgi:HlyD family secretion protein
MRVVRRLVPLLLLLAIAGAYAGYRVWLSSRPYEWAGTVEARTIAVGSRAGGRVAEVLVEEGDRVEAGQPLVELEPGDLPAQRDYAASQLAMAEAALEKLLAGARPEELSQARARAAGAAAALEEARAGARPEQIGAAEARLAAAEAALDKARDDAARADKLIGSGAITQAEVDAARTALRSATATRDAQARALDELKNGVRVEEKRQAAARAAEAEAPARLVAAGARGEDVKAAQAQVAAARARLAQIDVLVGELVVKAPRTARVEAIDLRPGDLLAPNAAAVTLLEDDQLYVRVYVPETRLGLIRVGQEVPVTVDSFPDESFPGVVEHIAEVGEYSPRNLQTADERAFQVFATRIGVGHGKERLRAGMAAMIRVER